MARFRSAIVVAVLVTGVSSAAGQTAPAAPLPVVDHARHLSAPVYEGASLTLRAALDEALRANPTLVAARLEFDAARQRRAQEGFLNAPTIEAQIWQWPLTSINPLNTDMYMFTATQEIPGRGKRALRAAVVAKDVEQASNEIAVRARGVLSDVKRAYADLVISRQAVAVRRSSVNLLRQSADLSTARYGSGDGSQLDALRTVVEISKLHADLVPLDARVQLTTIELNSLLNRPAGAAIGDLAPDPGDDVLPPVVELQRAAVESHPGLRGARIEIERAEAALAVADRDYKPDFMVGGGYMLRPRSAGAWTASVAVTWPGAPWARGRLDAARAQAAAEIAAAKARQEVVANAITMAVQQAYVRAMAADARAVLLRTSVIPQSEQTVEAARIAYAADRGDAVAMVENQRTLLDAQLEYYRALSDLQQARVDLERAVGADLEGVR